MTTPNEPKTMIVLPDRCEDHSDSDGCSNCGKPLTPDDHLHLFGADSTLGDLDEGQRYCSWFCLAEEAAGTAAGTVLLGGGDDEFDKRGWSIQEAP